MPSLEVKGYLVGGRVQAADEGRGAVIPGQAGSQGEVFGVWGGNGDGVAGSPSADVAREISGREAALG